MTSKCHGCQTENYPSFIVEGDKPNKEEKTDKVHHCNECQGEYGCPIVALAIQSSNKNKIFKQRYRQ